MWRYKSSWLDKKAVVGAVTTSWYLHKVDLMQIQVNELSSLLHNEYTSPGKIEEKMKFVNKNLKRMLISREAIRRHYEAIEAVKSQSEKLRIEDISTEITELKKATKALKKAIERRIGDIRKLRMKQQERQEKSMMIIPELSVPEVEEIVQAV